MTDPTEPPGAGQPEIAPFQFPVGPLTGEELMAEVERYFASGLGNPALAAPILDRFKKTGQVVHAVMATFNMEKVTMYRRRS